MTAFIDKTENIIKKYDLFIVLTRISFVNYELMSYIDKLPQKPMAPHTFVINYRPCRHLKP